MAIIPNGNPDEWRKILRHGNMGADVAGWQTVLIDDKCKLDDIVGAFGDSTHNATLDYQRARDLDADGLVGPGTRGSIGTNRIVRTEPLFDLSNIPFVQAENYTKHVTRETVDWIVIHCMQGPETSTRAEKCAAYFAGQRGKAPKASAHYCVDVDSIVQCVREDKVAWHAPKANRYGIGIEHGGFARQTKDQWLDEYGVAMLTLSAKLVAKICRTWAIPPEFVDAGGLRAGIRGVTTHAAVTEAFEVGTHWDPGKGFPMDWYLEQVRERMV